MESLSVFHYHIDIQYYLGQGILASFFQKGFPTMIQKSLPETIVERAVKITDAALLRQGRDYPHDIYGSGQAMPSILDFG